MFYLHDIVELMGTVADDGLDVPRGSRGVVIFEHPGSKMFEVEFRTKGNKTFAVSSVAMEDLVLIKADPDKVRAVA